MNTFIFSETTRVRMLKFKTQLDIVKDLRTCTIGDNLLLEACEYA